MTLKQFASEIVSNGNFVKASFGGFAGAGKTRTGSEFLAGVYRDLKLSGPILIIDNEHGSRFLIPYFKKELPSTEVYVKDTSKLADVIEAIDMIKRGEIVALFIDSLSKVWYQYINDFRAKNKIVFMTLQDWGKLIPAWQNEFSNRFVEASGTIVFTGRGGYSYEKEEDEKDEATGRVKKGQFVKSGVKMKMAAETPFEPDLNVWLEQIQEILPSGKLNIWREAQIMKDRSAMIDGKTFKNPKYKDFSPVVKFLSNLPVGEVAGATAQENIAPGEDFERWDRRQNKTIALEKTQALFDKAGLSGTLGKEERKIKVAILERIFGTTSQTEIEKLDPADLSNRNEMLSVLFKELVDVEPDHKAEYVQTVFKLPDESFNEIIER